jgi:hypothetical protein
LLRSQHLLLGLLPALQAACQHSLDKISLELPLIAAPAPGLFQKPQALSIRVQSSTKASFSFVFLWFFCRA